jgi:hypothetical protein
LRLVNRSDKRGLEKFKEGGMIDDTKIEGWNNKRGWNDLNYLKSNDILIGQPMDPTQQAILYQFFSGLTGYNPYFFNASTNFCSVSGIICNSNNPMLVTEM